MSGTSSDDNGAAFWLSEPASVDCLCVGTGRFLRSVLVPALDAAGYRTALIQPRGRSFLDFMQRDQAKTDDADGKRVYPVDTVNHDGTVRTDSIPCYGAFTLGSDAGKAALDDALPSMHSVSILGLGVTEAGLASAQMPAMKNLYDLLQRICALRHSRTSDGSQKLCVIDMDNVPNNGDTIRRHMMTLLAEHEKRSENENKDDSATIMRTFLTDTVVFFNTMVDRITAHRTEPVSDPMVPRCEPVPAKALVILDPNNHLPSKLVQSLATPSNKKLGVVVRTSAKDFKNDIDWKLRIANGTHTAIAHTMALCKLVKTDALSAPNDATAKVLCSYLDHLFQDQILPACCSAVNSASSSVNHQQTTKNEGNNGSGNGPDNVAKSVAAVYDDWRQRLLHPHFGLSTFFITQNGPAKGGIRLGPSVADLAPFFDLTLTSPAQHGDTAGITVTMAFAFAALLRWLTPCHKNSDGIYVGWLDGCNPQKVLNKINDDNIKSSPSCVGYADGLSHDLDAGWYEFRSSCSVRPVSMHHDINLSDLLQSLVGRTDEGGMSPNQPGMYEDAIRAYLESPHGGNLVKLLAQRIDIDTRKQQSVLEAFTKAVATLYARLIAGDPLLSLLHEMHDYMEPYQKSGLQTSIMALIDSRNESQAGKPLHYKPAAVPDHSALLKAPVDTRTVRDVVASEVQSAVVVDLHTHLLPPTHGMLCLWGIDELLTYHYLVAEYFMVAPASVTPEGFFGLSKQEQADLIWEALFVARVPISEACRGVVTVLSSLGLSDMVKRRDLDAIRKYYQSIRSCGEEGAEEFCERVFETSGIEYAIMTNIPFDALEAKYWKPHRAKYSNRFRSALRVDPLLAGDRKTIEAALRSTGYPTTLEGARNYLREWCDTMKPEYMMASTPHDFVLREGTLSTSSGPSTVKGSSGQNLDVLQQPFAFVDASNSNDLAGCASATCDGQEDDAPSVIDESSDFLSEVLMKVCEERDLPVALKIGAHRGVNPRLRTAGDGVVAFADAGMLGRLCSRFPKVRFLATFLSRNNQHEACVLATKFRNLHIYGCWWFCNNPSIIREITKMRVEMLGSAFTAQHSDARVVDQLLYKWPHSRSVIADVLSEEYEKLLLSGWSSLTREDVRRDVRRVLGDSYKDFMAKSLL